MQRDMNATRKKVTSLETRFKNFGRTLLGLAGVGGGLYAFKRGFESVVKAASDAEEISSKFDVVFKNLSTQANSWAENFGDSVGRSTQDVKEWMAGLQDTFVPLGIARDEAYDLSKALTTLAVDVGSFNNKADANVIRDFTSALVGNHETVRKYGIIISESAIKQAAINKGWTKSYKELTDLEKVMLRFELIQAGTTDAQGDAIRTGDSYANQIKRLKANFEELSVTIGNELVPALADAAKGLNDVFSRIDEMKANWADFYADFWGRQKIFDRINESWFSMDWSVKIKPNIEGVETFAEAEKKYRDIANRLRNKSRESVYVGPIFAPNQEETAAGKGTEGAAALTAEQMKAIVASTRDALEQMRSMDYLTRNERIMNLEAYKAAHADIMTDVTGKETESAKLINREIENLKRSRLDAMQLYYTELKNDMEDSALYTSEKFAEAARSIEGSMSSAFQSMISGGASFKEAMDAFLLDIAASFAKMVSDMASRFIMKVTMDAIGIETGSVAASATMATAITTSGATAATAMGTAITAAGSVVASQIAAAMGISGAIGSARGNIFNRGKITPFANGDIVNRPTLFPMAGGVGLMGESGPEAVMPLKRGRDGQLGVESSGGGTQNIKVIMVYDDRQAAIEAMNSSEGEKVIIRHVANNRKIFS